MDGCPTDDEYSGFLARELDETEASRMRRHIEQCTNCVERRARFVAEHESWIDRLQEAGAPRPLGELRMGPPTTGPARGIVAGYEIIEEVGRGGQGIVYRANQISTRREVALKVLREGPVASPSSRRRFEREIELVASFRHPNIVTVFDSGVTPDGFPFCVMDFVSGIRLDRYTAREQSTTRQTLALFSKVCDAVNYAHQRGVIHRDLKPSNIIVDDEGEPKVLDFGLARQIDEPADSLMTATGIVAGTLPYLSPEQARGGRHDVDIRSDVYTLGVILYEILTGQYPHSVVGEMIEVLRRIADTPPLSPSRAWRLARAPKPFAVDSHSSSSFRLREPLNSELETILLKALAKEQERRYQSAGDLAGDIRHFLADEPIEAKRDSRWYVFRKTLHRYKILTGSAALLLIVILGSTIALGVMNRTKSNLLIQVREQKQVAQDAEARARKQFDEVRKLARSFIFDFDPLIRNLVGALPARELLVTTGLEYLNRLSEDLPEDDVAMQWELGTAYLRMGDIQGNTDSDNQGDPEGARRSYSRGLQLLETFALAHPNDVKVRRQLWNFYNRHSSLLNQLGRREEAAESFQRALDLSEQLLEAYPDDPDLQREMTVNRHAIADKLFRDGRYAESLAIFREVLTTLQELARERPADTTLLHDLASVHDRMAGASQAKQDFAGALAERRESLRILAELSAAHPHNGRFQNDLCTAYERCCFVLQQLGRDEEALEHCRKALDIIKDLAEAEPRNRSMNANLRSIYCRVGELELAMGRTDAALGRFEMFRQVADAAVETFPDDAVVRRELGVSYYKMAELHQARAKNENIDREKRSSHWREAAIQLGKARDVFVDMDKRGILSQSDAGVPDELAAEIAQCESAIRNLEEETTSESDG